MFQHIAHVAALRYDFESQLLVNHKHNYIKSKTVDEEHTVMKTCVDV